jgi:hypothetical protein
VSPAPVPGSGVVATGQVISVVDKTAQDATNAWVPGETVTYQLSTGQTGSVWLPKSQATPDAVRAAVMADAERLAGIASIKF